MSIFFGATTYELVVVFSLEMPTESEKAVMEQFFQKGNMVRQSQVHMHPFTPILLVSAWKNHFAQYRVCVCLFFLAGGGLVGEYRQR